MTKLWLTRARQYAEKTAEALAGYEVVVHPLLEYKLLPPLPIKIEKGSVVAFTSAFAVEAYAKNYSTNIKAYCVGDSTAQTAKGFGMQVASADGDVEALQKLIMSHIRISEKIYHFAATETAGDLQGSLQARGYNIERIALYETRTCQKLDVSLIKELHAGNINGVLLYSPKTAVNFMELIKPLALQDLQVFCLSQNVADKISGLQVSVAPKPTEEALIKLIHQQFEKE